MTTHFPAFPHLYDPPGETVRLLREIDPAADLLYFGWGTWYLVRHRPNREHIAGACRALVSGVRLLEEWRTGTTYKANPGAFRRLYGRYLFWTAVRLGARPVASYDKKFIRRQGFPGIVDDFRRMEWMIRHTSDAAVLDLLSADHDTAAAAARAELTDEYAAVTMAEHLSRAPHSVTSHAPEHGRSGFTRHPTDSLVRSA